MQHSKNTILVFDLDNTLILRNQAMITCIEKCFDQTLSKNQKAIIHSKDEQGHSDRIQFCQWLQTYLELSISPPQIWKTISNNIGNFVELNKNAISTLQQLQDKYRLALLTNGGSDNQIRKIKSTGLDAFFDAQHIFISAAIGFSKPDPRAFQVVQDAFNSNTKFIMIGDHWENDILGAEKFGWKTIYLSSGREFQTRSNLVHPLNDERKIIHSMGDLHSISSMLSHLLKKK